MSAEAKFGSSGSGGQPVAEPSMIAYLKRHHDACMSMASPRHKPATLSVKGFVSGVLAGQAIRTIFAKIASHRAPSDSLCRPIDTDCRQVCRVIAFPASLY